MSPTSPSARAVALVLLPLVWVAVARPASAALPPDCSPLRTVPAISRAATTRSVPANVPALAIFHYRGEKPRDLTVTGPDGSSDSPALQDLHDNFVLFPLRTPLALGRHVVSFVDWCNDANAIVDTRRTLELHATEAKPLPTTVGTVRAVTQISDSSAGRTGAPVARVRIEVQLDPALLPFLPMVELAFDSPSGEATTGVNDAVFGEALVEGTGPIRLAAERSLALEGLVGCGPAERVSVTARLFGGPAIAPASTDVALDCSQGAGPVPAPASDAPAAGDAPSGGAPAAGGCSSSPKRTSGLELLGVGLALLVFAGRASRGRSALWRRRCASGRTCPPRRRG